MSEENNSNEEKVVNIFGGPQPEAAEGVPLMKQYQEQAQEMVDEIKTMKPKMITAVVITEDDDMILVDSTKDPRNAVYLLTLGLHKTMEDG